MTDLTETLSRPLTIGNRTITGRLILAPMTYLGHVAFREIIATFGGFGLLFSEMCSAKRIPTENRNTSALYRWREEELPYLVCQIVGADPAAMGRAAGLIEAEGFFGVDINFGCSVSTICKRNCGAALLKDPAQAAGIVRAVRQAVSIPVFAKFRIGWKDDPQAAVDLACRFEEAGADALTFHPRVAPDRRSRPPKWEYIRLVKEAVSIPVFGNGNVFSQQDCRRMLKMTACDGIAIGRMAIARPWIFAAWSQGLNVGPDIYLATALQLADRLCDHFDERRAVRRFKKFSLYFAANFRFGHTLHKRICNAPDMTAVRDVLSSFFENLPVLSISPNLNLFNN
jgi:nifR3 family TIM-barrel protein